MNVLSQISAVTWLNLLNVPRRAGMSLVVVVGIAAVTGVFISALALAASFRQTVAATGRLDRAIVLRAGSVAEMTSGVTRDASVVILDTVGVKHGENGRAVGAGELMASVEMTGKNGGTAANVALRGVGPEPFTLRPELQVVAGRMFEPGVREVVVGRGARANFAGLELGDHISIHDTDWTVVGIFVGGNSHESEILADAETVRSALHRNANFQSVTVLLESPDAFFRFRDALNSNPALAVDVKREPEYYAEQSATISAVLFFVAFTVGGVMAIGALFGTLNTMYSAISARAREIATLRAIGFGAVPVVISVFVEALVLALLGGLIGALLSWLLFNGNAINTQGGNYSQITFQLTITIGVIVLSIACACLIGILGGLPPAVRAARRPVAAALRAT